MNEKRTVRLFVLVAAVVLVGAGATFAQTAESQEIVVPLSEPGRPVTLEVSLLNGSIEVKAYEGNEVLVNAMHEVVEDRVERQDGMMRIPNTSIGMTVEERDNKVSIDSDWSSRSMQLVIQVPRQTSLHLSTVNNGDIMVEGARGQHELENVNGAISALDVAGSVVANTTNGDVIVRLIEIEADKPMSFSTWNGDVDVTMPGGSSAKLRMNSGQGDVYTDFEVALEPQQVQVSREEGRDGYRVRMEKEVVGRINGGDTEFRFKTYNGHIYLRSEG